MQKAGRHPLNLRFSMSDFRFLTTAPRASPASPQSAIGNRKFRGLRHIVCNWLQVLFHSPNRGSFRLSLAVLVHYRSTGSIQACEMVLADSGRIARVPPYLGTPLGQLSVSTTGLSPSMARLSRRLVYRESVLNAVPQPRTNFFGRFSLLRFRSPLLAESRLFSFPRGTEMFHFTPCRLAGL